MKEGKVVMGGVESEAGSISVRVCVCVCVHTCIITSPSVISSTHRVVHVCERASRRSKT